MNICVNLPSNDLSHFMEKWDRYEKMLVTEKTTDTIIIVDNYKSSHVDDFGVLHIKPKYFGYYIKIIDSLMESISSGDVKIGDISDFLTNKIEHT